MPIIYSISRKVEKGLTEVHMRFYQGRTCDLRARTRIYVPASAWNADEGRCNISRRYETPENIRARAAQRDLDELSQKVIAEYANCGGRVTREWLQRLIDGSLEEKPITEIIDEYCDAKDVAPRTRYKLHALQKHLQRYEIYAKKRLFAHSIERDDLDKIVKYLRRYCCLGQNALASRMRQIRALVYYGGKPYPNPFEGYTLPQEVYGDPFFLTADERDKVAACYKLPLNKRIQRDIFIFQCFTGCRLSDMYALTNENIKDGWLIYTPQKTSRSKARIVEVPLHPDAIAIVERYKGVDMKNRLLPFISDVKYNLAIRDILKTAGIDRNVMWRDPKTGISRPRPIYEVASSHLARRTFTQIAYAATGDKRLTASLTGHSENSRAFNRYSEVTRDMKMRALGFADKLPT